MREAVTVEGVVVNREGRAVSEATIAVVEGTSPVPEIALVADTAGRFALRLPPGRFKLEARGEGATRGQATVEVADAPVETLIEVT